MQVRFWGTRGSIAKAGPTTVRYGGNTSCVEVLSRSGTRVVLDCGTGGHGLGQALMAAGDDRPGHILLGHTHWDHIQGLPFFTPLFIPGRRWDIHGPRGMGRSIQDALAGQMQYSYFPVRLDQLGAQLGFHDLTEGTFELGDIEVTAWYLNHPSLTLGYRLRCDGVTVVYSTDHEPRSALLAMGKKVPPSGADERHARFLEDADLVIHDAQYTAEEYEARQGWGHSTVEYVVGTAQEARVRRLALFHHDPMRTDDKLDAILASARASLPEQGRRVDVFAAAEGQTVEVQPAAEPSEALPYELEAPARSGQPALVPPTVLMMVEDADLAGIAASALTTHPARLVRVDTPEAAWDRLQAGGIDLLLVSRSPDALALCQRLRTAADEARTHLPAVVLAREEHPDDAPRARAAGVTDILYTPFTEQYCRARVQSWLMRTRCRWQPAARPPDEAARLAALRALGLLDTPAEERFDRLARLAAALCDVPMAAVTLVDDDRQWLKAAVGVDRGSLPRDASFCAHAILEPELLHIPDTHEDDRFGDNPNVVAEPRVRFYAGAPLRVGGGQPVGTLCVFDQRARELPPERLARLRDLAALVERELGSGAR